MELVFASNNRYKIEEIQNLLPSTIKILSLEDIGCFDEIPETAATIEGNAILKANYVTLNYGHNCFADDSGLEISHLNGAPGVHSARFAGDHRNDHDNINKVLDSLKNVENRNARFKTVIALNLDEDQNLFTGTIEGTITDEKRGALGFGYDPIFQPNDYPETFAEMDQHKKSQISHRGQAVEKLLSFLNQK